MAESGRRPLDGGLHSRAQKARELRRAGALLGLLRQTAVDERRETRVELGTQLVHARWRLFEVRVDLPDGRDVEKRKPSRRQLERDDAEAVDVRLVGDAFAERLLGADVRRRADAAGGCHGVAVFDRGRAILEHGRDAKIEHDRSAAGALDHDVGGLDVAMDEIARVRGRQRRRYFPDDAADRRRGERPSAVQRVERVAFDELHDEVGEAGAREVTDFVDADHVGVRDGGGRLGFARKAGLG